MPPAAELHIDKRTHMKMLRKILVALCVLTFLIPRQGAVSAENWTVRWQVLDLSVMPQFSTEPILPRWPVGNLALPVCTTLIISDCIEGVTYSKPSGEIIEGKFVSYVPIKYKLAEPLPNSNMMVETYKYAEFTSSKFSVASATFDSGQSGLWSFSNLSHSNGNKFQVSVNSNFSINQKGVGLDFSNLKTAITPVNTYIEDINLAQANSFFSYGDSKAGNFNNDENWICYLDRESLKKYCQEKGEFTEFGKFNLKIRLRGVPAVTVDYPWLMARGTSVGIESKSLSENITLLEFSAAPVVITDAEINYPATLENYSLGRKIKNLANQDLGYPERYDESDLSGFSDQTGFATGSNRSAYRLWTYSAGASDDGYYLWKNAEGRLPEPKATSNRTIWNFNPINKYFSPDSEIRKCSKRNIPNGVISSNATVVRPTPPSWNATEKTIEFEIASPHLELDGSVKQGYYAISVEESVARCLWGPDINVAKATIIVYPTDGSLATTIETNLTKSNNGYFQFYATGFHYSANKVTINLQKGEEKLPAVEKLPEVEKPVVTVKKITIKCYKGKLTKKVTAVNPKCPAGYKKK